MNNACFFETMTTLRNDATNRTFASESRVYCASSTLRKVCVFTFCTTNPLDTSAFERLSVDIFRSSTKYLTHIILSEAHNVRHMDTPYNNMCNFKNTYFVGGTPNSSYLTDVRALAT